MGKEKADPGKGCCRLKKSPISLGFSPILRDLSVIIKMAMAFIQLLTENNPGREFAFGRWSGVAMG
jgi:hypothetical protein